jgi:lipopolysaccharide export system permease protein
MIAVAIDSSEHTENFVKSGLSTREIFTQYYIGFIPYIWGLLFPLFVFISVIYTTSRLAMLSEIIAILAGGTSYLRFLRPYFLEDHTCIITLYCQQGFIPKGNEIRSNFHVKYFDRQILARLVIRILIIVVQILILISASNTMIL